LHILTKKSLIDVNQDSSGEQGSLVSEKDRTQVWAKPLQDGDYMAVVLFNRDQPAATTIDFWWTDLWGNNLNGWTPPVGLFAHVWDLWRDKDLGEHLLCFSAEVPPHDVVVVKVA